jgi:hypothetical protein
MSIEFYLLIHANLFCAEYQIKTLRKFCKDPYKIIILDSNCGEHTDLSVALEKICAAESVELIKLPNELCMKGHGVSHILGTKLNYVYNNIIYAEHISQISSCWSTSFSVFFSGSIVNCCA